MYIVWLHNHTRYKGVCTNVRKFKRSKSVLEILFHWNRCVVWHCIETCIPSLEWFGPTVTKLCSEKGNPDADDDDTADENQNHTTSTDYRLRSKYSIMVYTFDDKFWRKKNDFFYLITDNEYSGSAVYARRNLNKKINDLIACFCNASETFCAR